jgi:hypothetical protein
MAEHEGGPLGRSSPPSRGATPYSVPSVGQVCKPGAAMASPAADLIVLDTLGKLHARGYGISGYCCPCRRYFRVPMPVLIAARSADSPVVGMRSPAAGLFDGLKFPLGHCPLCSGHSMTQ